MHEVVARHHVGDLAVVNLAAAEVGVTARTVTSVLKTRMATREAMAVVYHLEMVL
jgi:hypothetical protein